MCHPGITEVAKSIDTIVCTERTRGVASPAKTRDTVSYLDHVFAAPSQPKLNVPYIKADTFLPAIFALSLLVAKSGIKPIYQKTSDSEN